MKRTICNDCGGILNLLGRCHCPIPKHGTQVVSACDDCGKIKCTCQPYPTADSLRDALERVGCPTLGEPGIERDRR